MKLAILSESPADEAALKVLVGYVLGRDFALITPSLRARGWPSVEQVLPPILRHLHFNTDAHGLVVVCDSDDSPVHTAEHEAPGYHHPLCRICRLRAAFRRTLKNLPPAHGRRGPLRAIGLAVPAIEAWLLCGREADVTEAAWMAGQASGVAPFSRRDLKARVYGTTRPSLPWEIKRALEEVTRHRGDVRRLENDFPHGFGALARDLRAWAEPVPANGGGDRRPA
ncbi:hypothetical protein [Oleiharenicola sp. Vm1]|uniref:hypothetical protein n=1 Tax=Oleiharenicola sp. Vm1 TaxID=3398393 RepID=UPI0039F44D45